VEVSDEQVSLGDPVGGSRHARTGRRCGLFSRNNRYGARSLIPFRVPEASRRVREAALVRRGRGMADRKGKLAL
jgi:hypothetical protein